MPTVYIHLRTSGTNGVECGSGLGQVANVGGTKNVVTAEANSYKSDPESPCGTDRELVLDVSAFQDSLGGAKFELLVSQEPPLRSTRHLAQMQDTIGWQKMPSASSAATKPPVPGTSLSDAPTLAAGVYSTTILTGEKQVFGVPLDWGQRLQVEVVVPPRTGALARALSVSDSLDLQLLGRMRGEYESLRMSGAPLNTITMASDEKPYVVAATTPTISYLNRSSYDSRQYASTPGLQYIVLSKSRVASESQFLVPYRLIVKVIGKAGTGAPDYVAVATPTPTPTATATASPSPTAAVSAIPSSPPIAEAGNGVSTGVVIVVALAAVVVGVGGTAGAFAVRRRRS